MTPTKTKTFHSPFISACALWTALLSGLVALGLPFIYVIFQVEINGCRNLGLNQSGFLLYMSLDGREDIIQ